MTVRRSDGDDSGSKYSTVPRTTLPEEIARRVLTLIKDEELKRGEKLPPERDLSESLGVSRPVVREALRALALLGIVEIRQGAGTFVTALEPQQLIAHLDFVLPKDRSSLIRLQEARRIVEVANARLAATRGTDEQIERIQELLQELSDSVDDPARFRDLDIAFHTLVCEAADNFLLMHFMKIVNTLGQVSRDKTGTTAEFRRNTLGFLRSMEAAISSKDPDEAATIMDQHLADVEDALSEGR